MKFAFLLILLLGSTILSGQVLPSVSPTMEPDGLCHLDLLIVTIKTSMNGELTLIAKGKIDNETAAVHLIIGRIWRKMTSTNQRIGDVRLVKQGDESKVLANAFAKALKTNIKPLQKKEHPLTGIISGNPAMISSEPFWLEVINGAYPSEGYTEFLLYIDIEKRLMRLREDDIRFRGEFLWFLSEIPGT